MPWIMIRSVRNSQPVYVSVIMSASALFVGIAHMLEYQFDYEVASLRNILYMKDQE